MRLCLLLLSALALAGKSPITTTDLLKIQRVTAVEVAPSGAFAVFGVQSIHTEPPVGGKGDPAYSYRTHLFSIDLDNPNARPVQLTHGKRSDSSPTISPDGKQIAFLRVDESGGAQSGAPPRAQVWVMPALGPGEARQLSNLEQGVSGIAWRPDGKALLAASAIPLSKLEGKPHFPIHRPGRDWFDYDRKFAQANPDGDRAAIREWLAKNAAKDNPTAIHRLNFLGEQGLAPEMTISHLFLVDLETGKQTQLTKDFYSRANAAWSPDGASIAYVSQPRGDVHPDFVQRSAIWIMDAAGGNARALLDNPAWTYSSPRFSEDGKALYFTAAETDHPGFRQLKLARVELDGSQRITWLAPEWTSSVRGFALHKGDLYFTSNWQGGSPLLKLSGAALTKLVEGPTGVAEMDAGGGRIVFSEISVPNPNELYLIDRDGKRRRLTNLNAGWLAGKDVAQPEEKWVTRPDGVRVQYWVMRPAGEFDAARKYPVVLDMHGGPSAMWGPGEFTMWHEFQLFCAWGYGVVYANPRGSSGYGYEFQRANYKNWGEGPAADVLTALDEAIKANAWMDADRLFLTGGSYAGYLTAWIIGHDQRFKAAAAQRGVYDLTTFFGEANAWRLVPTHFGGYPWEPDTRKLLDQQSPFSYVSSIRTPFLILHGSQDLRTGVSQSEMLYKALAQLGRPVEYIRYPNIGHEQTRSGPPLQRMDHMLRILEFFERYAGNDRPAPGN